MTVMWTIQFYLDEQFKFKFKFKARVEIAFKLVMYN